jgi:hypothetical protein
VTNGNDYSQPQQFIVDQQGNVCLYENYGYQSGLTKREYFAVMAMQGLLSNNELGMSKENTIAQLAVKQADTLIDELNKTT